MMRTKSAPDRCDITRAAPEAVHPEARPPETATCRLDHIRSGDGTTQGHEAMLKLSKKIDYGLVLLSKLCQEATPASAREVAARYHLPQPMVANILKALAGAGVLTSTRGAQGGYVLARAAGDISLAEIVEALEGPFNLVDCVSDSDACRFTDICPTYDPLQVVHRRFQHFMQGLTLAEIVGQPKQPQFGFDQDEKAHLPG